MKYFKLIIVTLLLAALPVLAATNDVQFSANTAVSDIAFSGATTDLIVFSGSSAESFDINSGVFTVTNPGSAFKVGSSNASVRTIVVLKSGIMESCTVNSTPGTSSTTLPSASGVYTVRPLGSADCNSLCATLAGASTYNVYPTCGAATCASGYVKSGSGSGATCVVSGGGGGGGGNNNTTVTTTATTTVSKASTTTPYIATTTAQVIVENTTLTVNNNVSATEIKKTGDLNWQAIVDESNVVFSSGKSLDAILSYNNTAQNKDLQTEYMKKYSQKLAGAADKLSINELYALNNFIVYGTKTTVYLGAGERAGVVGSYKKAFNKLPKSVTEWKDCIAIGNGRWPTEKNSQAETNAKDLFKKIYLRSAKMENKNDNAAVTVMAYGLRPANRNTGSEANAIKAFRGILKKSPASSQDWDIVRAIAYSGAKR